MILLSRFIQILLSVFSIKLSTHILAAEEIGRVALVNSIVAFFSFLLINPIGMFVNRRLHQWWKAGKVTGYFAWYGIYLLFVAAIATLSFFLLPGLYNGLRMDRFWLFVLIGGGVVITTANMTLIPSLNLLGIVKPFAVLTVLTPALGLAAAYLLCSASTVDAEFWLLGILVGQMVAVFLVLPFYRCKTVLCADICFVFPEITIGMVRDVFGYSWPISIAAVLGWGQAQGYRLVLEREVGLHQLGMFVAAYGIALGVMSAMDSLISSKLQPRFYESLHSRRLGSAIAWDEYAKVALPLLALTAGVLAAGAWVAVHVFLGSAYWDTSRFVVWAAIIEFMRTASGVYSLALHATMETRRLLLPSGIGVVLSIGLLLPLSRWFGLDGVGPALALAGAISVGVYHLSAVQTAKIHLPLRSLGIALGGGLVAFALMQFISRLDFAIDYYPQLILRAVLLACVYALFCYALVRQPNSSKLT